MGLFGGLGGRNPLDRAFSRQEAACGILLAVVASDGDIADEEVEAFNVVANRHPIFREQSAPDFKRMVNEQLSILDKRGWSLLARKAAGDLPADLAETVFALAVDFVLADGNVDQAEEELIDQIRELLSIDGDAARQTVRVLAVKNGIR